MNPCDPVVLIKKDNKSNNNNNMTVSLTWPCIVEILDFIYYDKCTPFRAKLELGLVSWRVFNYMSDRIDGYTLSDDHPDTLLQHLNSRYCILKNIRFLKILTNKAFDVEKHRQLAERLAHSVVRLTVVCHYQMALGAMQLPPDAINHLNGLTGMLTKVKQIRFWLSHNTQAFNEIFNGYATDNIESFKLFNLEEKDPLALVNYDNYLFASNPTQLQEYRGLLLPVFLSNIEPFQANLTKLALMIEQPLIGETFIDKTLPSMTSLKSLRFTVRVRLSKIDQHLATYLNNNNNNNDNNRLEHLHLSGYLLNNDQLLEAIVNNNRLKTLSIPGAFFNRTITLNLSKLTIYKPQVINSHFLDEASSMIKRIVLKDSEPVTPPILISYFKNNRYLQQIKGLVYSSALMNALKDRPETDCLRAIELKVTDPNLAVRFITSNIASCQSIHNAKIAFSRRIDIQADYDPFKCFTKTNPYNFLKIS
ncbi:hypothetical protein PPL_08153 [Heterostelium album PN500]|uniref:Uncharacterized protein n=1 Tax=Heterostelium pallidum (strain ATCC 26659 / Pp 5 / PN500) TaxID=670386 RepID=D3BIR8_HETP5|nr:hypothetical protein PPL_08153 [Heterostelium album PN500]EFA78692.1 hypothetical protein PPL_08153 [Heterostelium album PN500]|eukprot:XP_020430816.1 hypothetical protein PPL_08153 [Heterostelium album PN500]